MLGAIIGDMIGSCYEWNNIKSTDFPLFSEKSRFTDDTVMTVAVAAAVMQGYGNPELTREAVIASMRTFGSLFPDAGYGAHFTRWLSGAEEGPYNSFGNGSAMRVSSVAWAYDSLEEVEKYARITAEVTHNHPEGIKGACALAGSIFMALHGATKDQIRAYAARRYGYNMDRRLDDIRPLYSFDVSCQGSVPEAILAFLESENFEDAVRKAVSLGGDSDTIADMAGALAEAAYGPIPDPILNEAMRLLPPQLAEVLDYWMEWLMNRASRGKGCHCGHEAH